MANDDMTVLDLARLLEKRNMALRAQNGRVIIGHRRNHLIEVCGVFESHAEAGAWMAAQ